ncbi:MAG: isoprenyl transferase [Rubrobacteridae bacterium]|nr:isoprenyl transferase [Rubrobacteridae bacterium]
MVPQHVAIIMDGNGRWARKRKKPRIFGHRAGAKAIREVVEISDELGVEYLTLYAFSRENWRRPKEEVKGLMGLFEETIRKEIVELSQKNVRIKVLGRIEELPGRTREAFEEAQERTKSNTGLKFNIALNYGGRAEIVEAVKAYCEAVKKGSETQELTEDIFEKYLYTSDIPDPALLIRTSGEKRVSNFLLWQIAYSEIVITEKLWPDFKKIDFIEAVNEFQQRKRRFGGLDEE